MIRLATWNVNSLKVRLPRVEQWLAEVDPDIVCLQETKLADDDVPRDAFASAGYEVAHHGEGRWNGVAIASRVGIADPITNFGDGPVRNSGAGASVGLDEEDFDPSDEARMVSAVAGGIRFVCLYAPNGRIVGSAWYEGKLRWFERLARWLAEAAHPAELLAVGGDLNVAPEDIDVWDPRACHGGTHVSPAEREAFGRLCRWGLVDAYRLQHPEPGRYTWWDYRAGNFHKNFGMRIDHVYVSPPLAARALAAERDREARKPSTYPGIPSDHAPLIVDFDD